MAESTRAQPSTAWDRTTRPTAVWNELTRNAGTDEERACIAAATRQADRVWVALHTPRLLKLAIPTDGGQAGRTVPARNADWHRLALSAYEVLRVSAAYGHLAQLRPLVCAAVEPVLTQWLNSPDPASPADQSGARVNVAQRLGIGDAVHQINGDTQAAHLSTVVAAAQDAAVFGVARHRVELVTAPGTSDAGPVVRVVVDTPHGLALASQPMQLGVLVDPTARGIDAATAALRRVADVVTGLFERHSSSVWHSPPPIPTLDRATSPTARAFPKLRLDQQAAPPVSPTPSPVPSPTVTPSTSIEQPRTGRPR
jgi:hypothetical protein